MKHPKRCSLFSLLSSLVILACTVYGVSRFFVGSGSGNMQVGGFACFRYFTVLSNVFVALCCAAVLPYNIRALTGGNTQPPHGVMLLKFTGTLSVTVTLVVVLVFLGPTMGYAAMFAGSNLLLHLLTPLLTLFSFCALDGGGRIGKREILLGVFPVVIYGVVYLILVVALGIWEDFYGFNRGGLWYVSFPAVLLGSALLSAGVGLVHNLFAPKKSK